MSCIATAYRVTKPGLDEVIQCANAMKTISTGFWIFKRTRVINGEAFNDSLKKNLVDLGTFPYSGYTFIDVEEIGDHDSKYSLPVTKSPSMKYLEKIFGYGGYIIEEVHGITVPSDDVIIQHLRSKYQDLSDPDVAAIRSAYEFYNNMAKAVDMNNIVVIGLQ